MERGGKNSSKILAFPLLLQTFKMLCKKYSQGINKWPLRDLAALPLVCGRESMFVVLSEASWKDSKHFIKISPPILFYPGAANEGVESFANLSQFEPPWLPREKAQVSAGLPYRKPNLIIKVSVIQSQLLLGVSLHHPAAKIVLQLVNCPSPSKEPHTLKEFDSIYHMLPLYYYFFSPFSEKRPTPFFL